MNDLRMNNKLIIRRSTKEDLDGMLKLYQQTEMDNGDAIDQQHALALFEQFSNYPFYHFYVACHQEFIVGVFGLLIMDNIGHQGSPSAIIEGVCVDENFQGQGIGKAMMQEAINISREHGCYKMALTSNIRREKAHAFYRSLGFKQHGISFQIEF